MPNITSITPPRVPLTDPRTGLITREWYRFFLNLFTLAGNGTTDVSLQDLLVSPGNRSEELTARVDEIYAQLFNQPTDISSELQAQIDSLRQLVLTLPRPDLGTMASVEQDNVRFLGFNTLPSFTNADQLPAGTMWWDSTGTLNLRMGNGAVTQQIGDELYVYGKASEAITEGQVVAVTGSDGTTGVVKFEPAPIGTTDANDIVGIATENIAKNGYGRVTAFGVVHGLNTAGLGDGLPIWYNPAVLGGYTITEPSAPNIKVQVGVVIKAAGGTNGSVQVKVIPGSKLGGTDSNVQFGTLNNGDLISYDSALGYWKNVSASSIGTVSSISFDATGLTPATATTGAVVVGGTLAVSHGGTGQSSYTNGQLLIGNSTGNTLTKSTLTAGTGVSITNGSGSITISATGTGGTVTSVSVVSANGLAGTVANASTTPAITLSTSVTGVLKGNGTAISAAVAATDYVAPSAYASANGLTMATARLLGRTTAGTGAAEEISVGTGLSLSAGSLSNSSPMTYPGSGIPNSTGSAWGTSYSTTGTGTVIALATSPSFTTPSLGNATAGSINGTTIGLGGGSVTSNLAIGQQSLPVNTTGNNNTAIGAISLFNVTTGTYNTAIGGSAGFTTNGDNNTFIGSTSGYYTTGSSNVIVGRNALFGVAGSTSGNENTVVGYAAMFGATSGRTNTCIGFGSGYGLTSGSYNVIVGAYRGALSPISATGSNYIVMSDGQQNVAGYWLGTTGAMTNIGSITAPSFIPNSSTVPTNGIYLPAANTVGVASNSTAVIQVLKGRSVALEGASVQVGTGITFPATQVASSDANTLDDYVEGSFTPVIRFGGASTGITYTTQTGRYTKIGRFVYLYIRIVLSNKGSSTGNASIVAGTGSFPTSGDNGVGSFDPFAAMAGLTAGGAVLPVISSTTITPVQQTTTGRAPLTDANFTNTSDFRITICYAV